MPSLLAINNYYYPRGGSEAVYFGHNHMLEALGWTVVPFSMKRADNLPTPWSQYFIEELELSGPDSLGRKLGKLPKVIYSFEARKKLAQLLEQFQPDIAHGHNIYHHLSPSILGLLKDRGIPTVLTLHDLKVACPAYTMLTHDGVCERCKGGRLHNVVVHRCIGGSSLNSLVIMLEATLHRLLGSYRRCVDRFIVPSRFYIEKLVEWGLPREQFRYIPNFVDVGRYEPRYEPGEAFMYFGRITRQKGVATLIRAVAATGRPLLIAGTGPDLPTLQELAAQLRAPVSFLGQLSGEALHGAIRSARAVVLPSEWYENAPVSVLEAYALGKPVIGARIGGIPELIRQNETGLSFESSHVGSLAEAIETLAARPALQLEEMGRAGRRWVERDFTIAMYQQRILNAYHELGVSMPVAEPQPLKNALVR